MSGIALSELLKFKVNDWRASNYESKYPAISELFNFNLYSDDTEIKNLRYLRKAQYEALETYWYLRLVEETPHIFELYKKLIPDHSELLKSLSIHLSQEDLIKLLSSGGIQNLFKKIKDDDSFVRHNKLQAVRETLTLNYSSYILALAMGAGKTALIGTIIVTEFAMALEYGGNNFVKNALVFAPGKTILGALKELSDVPYDKILPPRLYKQFISSVKITYTQDGQKEIPIIWGSNYNIIVTNTEKIRIQKPNRKTSNNLLLNLKAKEKEEAFEEMINNRLRAIASLPDLAIFSDEAHHTYGQSLEKELKKVRQTVDYLAQETNVKVVVNTTGTPYYKKQMLKDVVFWYGLSQGIKDGILKDVKDSIISFSNISSEKFIVEVLKDFFTKYASVKIFDGANSKIAFYFPQTSDVKKAKPIIERTLIDLKQDSSIVYEVNNKSTEQTKDYFNNRVNESHNPYRVYLLVNMGTEGWNCPSLFATVLARKLKSSNNFVLQAATRCLRQTPGNILPACIYLSKDNVSLLDNQLKETFGETLQILDATSRNLLPAKLTLIKIEIPKILIKKIISKIVPDKQKDKSFYLIKPETAASITTKDVYGVSSTSEKYKVLSQKDSILLEPETDTEDFYQVALDFANIYRLDLSDIYSKLLLLYPEREVPVQHIIDLKKQIEAATSSYKIEKEEVEVALALIKPEGFNRELIGDNYVLTTEIMYHKDKVNLLTKLDNLKSINQNGFSFHYDPYNMDSNPEKDFFINLIEKLNENPDNIEDIYFTGAITDPNKTEFLFEYKDKNGKWHNYTPDFVLMKKDGKILIVEVKSEPYRNLDAELMMHSIEESNKDKIKYELLLTDSEEIGIENLQIVKNWIYK